MARSRRPCNSCFKKPGFAPAASSLGSPSKARSGRTAKLSCQTPSAAGILTFGGEQPTMSLRINDTAPDFTAETTQGPIHFHEWVGDGWGILFSHPKDFTPVCTTELGYMAGLEPEFTKLNCTIVGPSVPPATSHAKCSSDIVET